MYGLQPGRIYGTLKVHNFKSLRDILTFRPLGFFIDKCYYELVNFQLF